MLLHPPANAGRGGRGAAAQGGEALIRCQFTSKALDTRGIADRQGKSRINTFHEK